MRRYTVLIGQPHEVARVGDNGIVDDAVLVRHGNALEPLGRALPDVLLKEPLRADAAMKALHRHRSARQMWQHDRRDELVVRDDLALGDAVVRKHHLLRMRDHVGAHDSGTTSLGALSDRTPSRREWRSFPCTVHSMNATSTTISGLTQCARTRGSPFAFVNSGFST